MHKIMDRRVWVYAVCFAAAYTVMKFGVPWHSIFP